MPRNIRDTVASSIMPKSRMRITRVAALTPNIRLISTSSPKPKSLRRRPTSRISSPPGARKAPGKPVADLLFRRSRRNIHHQVTQLVGKGEPLPFD